MKKLSAGVANPYVDAELAEFYDGLDYVGTYQLAFRDQPDIISQQVTGKAALDFACGCGRSTRFLKSLGLDATGVDVSPAMLANAQRRDPGGRYLLVGDGDLSCLRDFAFNLILSAFPLASLTTARHMQAILSELRSLLAPGGRIILIEPTDVLYWHEWLTFSTSAFPENAKAKSGDPVPIHYRDHMVQPVIDILWTDEDYRKNFQAVGLWTLETHRPLAHRDDPGPWLSERDLPPWVIYVLSGSAPARGVSATD